MAAMPATDRVKALVTGRDVGYPFGTRELWVGAAVVLLVLAVGESILRETVSWPTICCRQPLRRLPQSHSSTDCLDSPRRSAHSP